MSRSWRDRLLISFAPGELSCVRLAGRYRSEILVKQVVPVDAGYGARLWDGAVAALRAEAARWVRDKLSVCIVLSNHFTRYALIPSSAEVSGHDEELALAKFHFNKLYGDTSQGWEIRLNPARPGGPRLACAMDIALLEALRESFPRDGSSRLASIQPMLMSVFNGNGANIPEAGAWLVLTEPGRACVALLKDKSWRAVQNVKGHFTDVASWIGLIERERWHVDLDVVPDTVLIHAADSADLRNGVHGAWKVAALPIRWPHGLSPARDGAFITALSAA